MIKWLNRLININYKEVEQLSLDINWLIELLNLCDIDEDRLNKFLENNPIPDDRITVNK